MKIYEANPHYLEFQGRPVLVVGSGEHYGAVLNAAFDYVPYLDELAHRGLNQLRVFSGTYRELPGEFGIADNNLAPVREQFLCPWKPVGEKWDLAVWDDAYWTRLKAFTAAAAERAILVEYVLFCFWYNLPLWQASPMHPANNVQGLGPEDREQVFTVGENALLSWQEAFVRKAVAELAPFDNVYFEVCNEPYSRHDHTAYEDWQRHIAGVIHESDPGRLVALNYQNRTLRIEGIDPHVSICNFHYALPDAVKENYHLARPIVDDETGFAGQSADPYRRNAWLFLLAGGAGVSHLDYSFTVTHPDGSAPITGKTPGYGGVDLREQLGFLRRFLEEIEVWRLHPRNEVCAWSAGKGPVQILGDPGRLYALYFAENLPDQEHGLGLPVGTWTLRWFDPVHCRLLKTDILAHEGVYLKVASPPHEGEVALVIERGTISP